MMWIVRAANYYLDTSRLTWEEVNKKLSSQEQAWARVWSSAINSFCTAMEHEKFVG